MIVAGAAIAGVLSGCEHATLPDQAAQGATPTLVRPVSAPIPTIQIAPAKGWPKDVAPRPAPGLAVNAFAQGLEHPRWLYVLPNGDVLVAETNAPPKPDDGRGIKGWFMKTLMRSAGAGVPSANRITLLRDTRGTGVADSRTLFLQGLNSPFGMVLVGNDLYVACTDAILRFPYTPGATQITQPGEKIVDLPAGTINHHWTKNVIASPDGSRLFVTVGSNSNVAERGMENEVNRAAILEVDLATRRSRVYASGLRNPNGLGWQPQSGVLWTVVNERDELGSDLVPDYMTSVRDGAFYGWPYSYYGQTVDDRVKPARPDLVSRAVKPDYALGPHTGSLVPWRLDMRPAVGQFAPTPASPPAGLIDHWCLTRLSRPPASMTISCACSARTPRHSDSRTRAATRCRRSSPRGCSWASTARGIARRAAATR